MSIASLNSSATNAPPTPTDEQDAAGAALEHRQVLLAGIGASMGQGLAANIDRFLHFRATRADEWVELQVLDGRGRSPNYPCVYFTHVDSPEEVLKACNEGDDELLGSGVFFVMNQVNPAVRARARANEWHPTMKNGGTTDSDIVARCALMFDFDPKRPKGISASEAERELASKAAVEFYVELADALGPAHTAVGFGFSGNGSHVYLALDHLAVDADADLVIKGLLACASALNSTDAVAIDRSVSDAKRLCPAFGTMKRKGEDDPERPHRRTWFWCADEVYRLSLGDLQTLLDQWMGRLSPEQRADVERAMGKKADKGASKSTKSTPTLAHAATMTRGSGPFAEANAVPVEAVATWLGMMKDGHPVCVGCETTGDSSVAFIGNGLKCHHDRCAQKGKPGTPGFRTVVDLVCEARGVSPVDAVRLIAERFGTGSVPPYVAGHRPGGTHDVTQQAAEALGEEVAATWAMRPATDAVAELEERWKNGDAPAKTGLVSLDALLGGGFRSGDVVALAGAAGSAKSAFADQVAYDAAGAGALVVIASVEMPPAEIHARWLALELFRQAPPQSWAIHFGDVFRGRAYRGECASDPATNAEIRRRLDAAMREVKARTTLFVKHVPPGTTPAMLDAFMKKIREKHPERPAILIVDPIQRLYASESMKRRGRALDSINSLEVERVGAVAQELKHMADVEDFSVIFTSDTTKSAVMNNTSSATSLRGSYELNHLATTVLGVYSGETAVAVEKKLTAGAVSSPLSVNDIAAALPAWWGSRTDATKLGPRVVVFECSKNRQGPQKSFALGFVGGAMTFVERDRAAADPAGPKKTSRSRETFRGLIR